MSNINSIWKEYEDDEELENEVTYFAKSTVLENEDELDQFIYDVADNPKINFVLELPHREKMSETLDAYDTHIKGLAFKNLSLILRIRSVRDIHKINICRFVALPVIVHFQITEDFDIWETPFLLRMDEERTTSYYEILYQHIIVDKLVTEWNCSIIDFHLKMEIPVYISHSPNFEFVEIRDSYFSPAVTDLQINIPGGR